MCLHWFIFKKENVDIEIKTIHKSAKLLLSPLKLNFYSWNELWFDW